MARKKRFAPNDNNLAIAYYRFSSHSQNDASIDQQRELAHEWADAHGFKIVQEYEDAAISGTTDARPGFQQMLSEVAKIRPHTLIMWKTDRLGRDKYVLAMAKKKIRDAGCEIHLLAEHIPTEGPEGVLIEGLMEAMAEYYSRQLSQNIQRGMDYNAQHALYNGHKLFGYDVDRSTKKYIPDPNTAPFVQWAFREYASGKPLKTIAEEMNAQGLRTPRNAKFSVNMLNKMLKNRAYIGEYHHGDITVAGGMPVLVDEATFDRAQRRFAENKRKGSQRAHGMDGSEAPRYWLTGKLYCGECGSTMQGVSGASKTGRTYYYYYCSAQRRKECHLHKARKQDLEDMVLFALHNIVDDEENVTALALDAAEYYEKNHNDTAYLEAQGGGEEPREPREGHREGRGQRYGDTTPRAARRAEERPERCHRDGKRPRVAVRGQAQHPGVLRQVPACRRERPGDSRPGLRVFRGQGLPVRRQARREHVVLRGRQAGNHVAGLVLAG